MLTRVAFSNSPTPNPVAAESKQSEKLAHVAKEFEAVMLRQLLAANKIAGKSSETGYGSMAVDGLASGIVNGGGLGLARQLQESLARALDRASGPPGK